MAIKPSLAQILAMPGIKPSQKAEMIKTEMWRKSMDLCVVKNPTNQDFVFRFDNIPYRVQANGKRRMVRYLCDNYLRRMIDYLIGQENAQRVKEENDRRVTHGGKAMDAQERSMFDLRIDNPELIKKYYPSVWGGVVEPFAMDDIETNDSPEIRKVSAYEQLDSEFGDMKAGEADEYGEDDIVDNEETKTFDEPMSVYNSQTLEDKTRTELIDMARIQGIKFDPRDTKAALMNKLTGTQ
jgi:hypothetical protein